MVNRSCFLLLVLLFLALGESIAGAVTVQAVADRDRISVNESLQLQLRVSGSPDGDPDLSALEKNWEILSRAQSSQVQIINGSFSRSVVYNLTLMPRKQGTVMIPAVCFSGDCSLPLPIEVTGTADKDAAADDPLLLETEVSPRQVVAQGQVVFRVRLLRRVDLLEGQLGEPQPTGVAAVVKKLGDDRSYETRRNGRLYQVIERDYAIFPQGSGKMTIPALQFDGSIAAGRSRFDLFGQPGRRVRRTSKPLQVDVLPVPADIGGRQWLPAAALELHDDWQSRPPRLKVGEPVTRTLRLKVTGLPSARLPKLEPGIPASFKSYPDQPQREDASTTDGITGNLVQKVALVPTRPGRFTLPAFDLDWWDTKAGRWRKAHLDALNLEVIPAADGAAATTPVKPAPPVSRPSTVSPEPAPAPVPQGAASEEPRPSSPGFWPWLCLALAVGWLLTLILVFRRRQPRQLAVDVDEVGADEKTARRAVVQAARAHRPDKTRRALEDWSRILWPGTEVAAYERLYRDAGPELRSELDELDRSLYGRAGRSWRGDGLADRIVSFVPSTDQNNDAALPELYPRRSGRTG